MLILPIVLYVQMVYNITVINKGHSLERRKIMSNITCPWDASGKLIPGITVRQYVEYLISCGTSGNITIDHVYYNLHSLLIAPPDGLNLDSIVVALDPGYYGNHGVLTK